MQNDMLYTPEEIALKLKITKNTVYEMIKRGDLAAHRVGKHLRISDTQFAVYLLKSKGSENSYQANILTENGEKFALIDGTALHVSTDLLGEVKVSIRPEDIILSKDSISSSARNMHKGIVTDIFHIGSTVKIVLDIGIPLVALITERSLQELAIQQCTELFAIFKATAVIVYK